MQVRAAVKGKQFERCSVLVKARVSVVGLVGPTEPGLRVTRQDFTDAVARCGRTVGWKIMEQLKRSASNDHANASFPPKTSREQ